MTHSFYYIIIDISGHVLHSVQLVYYSCYFIIWVCSVVIASVVEGIYCQCHMIMITYTSLDLLEQAAVDMWEGTMQLQLDLLFIQYILLCFIIIINVYHYVFCFCVIYCVSVYSERNYIFSFSLNLYHLLQDIHIHDPS